MCQTNVLLEKSGQEELLLENVTSLEVLENCLKITTLFDGPKELTEVSISSIDFADGKVLLRQS